ncbi:MAG: hypothetical protein EAZ92_17335 [Candidatus Kapaibacterium sp.]|nr:MAG: hypothetical protein EAZ92_17335 [Candidatus Kapabacteria bacterium]
MNIRTLLTKKGVILVLYGILCCGKIWSITNPPSAQRAASFDLHPGKKLVFKNNVFEKGSSAIAEAERPQFSYLLEYLKARPQLIIEVSGHTDNIGSPELNVRLSEARANAVRSFLISQGVAADRIRTRGLGAAEPIASNDTEEGRAQNRRIEVVALGSRSERPQTVGRNTPAQAEGHISALLPSVLSQAPWDDTWQKAHLGAHIYEYHRIRTIDKARAEITFQNKQRVQIAENSVVMIYGAQVVADSTKLNTKPNEQIRLMKGSVFVKMKSLQNTQEPMLVKTANGEVSVALNKTAAKIELNAANQSLVSVHEGDANVRNATGAAMNVPENFGTRVSTDAPPEKPRPLPPVPELIAPNLADSLFAGEILFQWSKQSPRVRFEIAKDITFQKPLHAFVLGQDSMSLALPKGEWYVRLSSIDAIGLESRSSIYRLRVAVPSPPFRFYILTVLLFVAAIGVAWWAGISRQKKLYAVSILLVCLAMTSFFVLHW